MTKLSKVPVSAIHTYKKSCTAITSSRTTKSDVLQKYLCIYFIPKPNLLQRLKTNRRHAHEFY